MPLFRAEEEEEERRFWHREGALQGDYEFSSVSGYPHNTYHGQTRHLRPSINFDVSSKPVRFTDSPQHNNSSPYAQSPRRKSSSASNDSSDHPYNYASPPTNHLDRPMYIPLDYQRQESSYADRPYPPDYQNRMPPGTEMYHYYHEYGRADSRMPLDASTGISSNAYWGNPDIYTMDRVYPDYVRHQDGYHAYENPTTSSTSSLSTQWTPPTRHAVFTYDHRRTPSNASNSSSNVNPSFRLEDEGDLMTTPTHRLSLCNDHTVTLNVNYSSVGVPHPPPRSSRHNSLEIAERPTTLDIPRLWPPGSTTSSSTSSSGTGMQSVTTNSKMKYSTTVQVGPASCCSGGSPKNWASTSGGGTPTNPTSPDSVNTPSEDSSYVSARLHFSPMSPSSTGNGGKHVSLDGSRTLLDLPVEGQSQDSTKPLTALRQLGLNDPRPRKISGIELEREFL